MKTLTLQKQKDPEPERVIWKYEFSDGAGQKELQLPKNARVLSFDVQPNDVPCIWCMVDPNEKSFRKWDIRLEFTGHRNVFDIAGWDLLGTARAPGLDLVYHCFYRLQ